MTEQERIAAIDALVVKMLISEHSPLMWQEYVREKREHFREVVVGWMKSLCSVYGYIDAGIICSSMLDVYISDARPEVAEVARRAAEAMNEKGEL